MNDDSATITSWRLLSQQLAGPRSQTVEQAVHELGGVQAQDYGWAKWSIGLRGRSMTEALVERAVAGAEIVRTWAWRGTLHFVAAEDVGWLTALLAPRIVATNARRYRQLELDDETFARSNDVLERILTGGQRLERSQIAAALEKAGISAEGQRVPYLLQRAALDGLICLGPSRGRKATYVLLADWSPAEWMPASIPAAWTGLSRDEALARLAQRYFASHGPASVEDFAWWSGLLAADARAALDAVRASLVQVTAGGKELWAGRDFAPSAGPAAHLLPPFDEYLLGYKDRRAAVDPAHTKKINRGGGMLKPAILVDGKVVGTWKRTWRSNSINVTAELFHPLEDRAMNALVEASRRFGEFYEMPIEMVPPQ